MTAPQAETGRSVVDLHCHILPGIDDGARSWEEALAMARAAVEAGVTHLVATPHHLEGVYRNPRSKVVALVAELRERLADAGIPLAVFPGTEAHIGPDLPARVKAGEVATVNDGGRYVLVELPYVAVPPWTDEVLFQLQVQGLTPILAHPERNRDLQKDPTLLARWVERGMLVQLDAVSLARAYGQPARLAANRILARGLASVAGSDAHGLRDAGHFAALARLARVTDDRIASRCLAGDAVEARSGVSRCEPLPG